MARCRRLSPRKNIIRNVAGLAALLLIPALTLTNAASALATDPFYQCEASQHCYSVAFANNSYYGVESNFSDHALTIPSSEVDSGGHISNEIWLTTTNGTSQDPPGLWVEFGVARGCSKFVHPGQTCSGLGGTSKYEKFYGSENQNQQFFFHPFDEASSHDGVNHTFQIWNNSLGSSTDYQIWLGTNGLFNLIGTVTSQINPHGISLQAGMELFSPPGINTNESSDSFDNKVHVWRVGQSNWDVSTLDGGTVHDVSQCDGTVNCAMDPCSEFAQGKCLSWALNTPNEWVDQKP